MNAILEGRLRVQLGRDEGYRRWLYRDSQGHPTIGIGHLLSKPISDAAVEQMFRDDLAEAETIRRRLPWMVNLSEARQGVLYNMAFNLGVAGLMEFRRMLTALERGEYDTAANEMLNSAWAGQVGDRAQRLAKQMREDVWV